MKIRLLGTDSKRSIYQIQSSSTRNGKLEHNKCININLNKDKYLKLQFFNFYNETPAAPTNVEFSLDDDHYPIIFNPMWNAQKDNNGNLSSENVFYNIQENSFQKKDDIDILDTINCFCTDTTRVLQIPAVVVQIHNHKFTFNNWQGSGQIWTTNQDDAFATILLSKESSIFCCSIKLPKEYGDQRYEFFSQQDHTIDYDELGRLDCFKIRPKFTQCSLLNYSIFTQEGCPFSPDDLTSQIGIETEYSNVE